MLRNNIISNFFGRVWPSLLGFLLVPVYIRYLGIESYGLIGFFTSLQALISFLDLGLSRTANREVALGVASGQIVSTRNILRTLELVYVCIAVLILLIFYLSANWIALNWINVQELSLDTVRFSIMVYGITLAMRWPIALYNGMLQGRERQVLLNVLSSIIATVRNVGGAIVVVFFYNNILSYLIWMLFSALLEIFLIGGVAWKVLQEGIPSVLRLDFSSLRGIWRYSFSIGLNSIFAAFLKQLDRLIIAKMLLVQQVGYYTTANSIYLALSLFTSPFQAAAFPRFTALITEKKDNELASLYHKMATYISFLISPIASVLVYFSYQVILIWTRSQDVAINSAPVLSALAVAALFNAMMQIPFMLQLAAGITWISLWNNGINLVLLAPLMYFLVATYGLSGAGISWVVFNVLYYLITPHIMHRYILQDEKWKWFFRDTLPFILLGQLIFGGIYLIGNGRNSFVILFFELLIGLALYILICLAGSSLLRASVMDLLFKNMRAGKAKRVVPEQRDL